MNSGNPQPPTPTVWQRWLLAAAIALEAIWIALLIGLAVTR
jgi:hypothetical protein